MPLTHSPTRSEPVSQQISMDQQNNANSQNPAQIGTQTFATAETATISMLKIPSFWKSNPVLWFAQVETIFRVHRITRGDTKFDHILCNLDPVTLEFVADIVLSPPAEGCKYEALKKKLINTFAESDEKKLRKLLTGNAIGDQKPTHYLQFMRNSGGSQVSESVLKALFMEQMPENVRAILVGNKGTLDDIAEQADKILEQLNPSISAVSNISIQQELLAKVEALEKRFGQFSTRSFSESSRSRDKSQSSSSNRHRRRSRSRSVVKGWCWYHNNFKDKALKCTNPCSYSKN